MTLQGKLIPDVKQINPNMRKECERKDISLTFKLEKN